MIAEIFKTIDFFRFVLVIEVVIAIIFSIANTVLYCKREWKLNAADEKTLIYVLPIIAIRNLIFLFLILGVLARLGENINYTTPVQIILFFTLIIFKYLLFRREATLNQESR